MIQSLSLGNFKAFGPTQQVAIKPLTLIFGPNSAGKSSIIHGLLLSHHAMQTDNLDAHLMNISGESVDLGGFRQYVFRRDVTRLVDIAFSFQASEVADCIDNARSTTWGVDRKSEDWRNILNTASTIGIVVNVGIKTDDFGRVVPGASPELKAFEVTINQDSILRFALRPDRGAKSGFMLGGHPVIEAMIKAIVSAYSWHEVGDEIELATLRDHVYSLVTDLQVTPGNFIPLGLARPKTDKEVQLPHVPMSKPNRMNEFKNALDIYFPQLFNELLLGIRTVSENNFGMLSYLGPLRSYPPRHLAFHQQRDSNWYAGGGYAWELVMNNAEVRANVNRWLNSPDHLQTPYELAVKDLVPMDENSKRAIADELEEIGDTGLDEIIDSYDKEGNPERTATVIKDPESASERIQDRMVQTSTGKLQELVMIDNHYRPPVPVTHRDVGVGVSQVLPVLAYAYAYKNKLIAIEQPEIHIHPKLQAELADVFIESALGERKNTFLLETHSEHLILRIMRRMRETFEARLPKGLPAIRPKDVSILFVEPTANGSIVREMELNERGELVKAWPGGFFEEGLNEAFA